MTTSTTSATSARKPPSAAPVVYSQPADTGHGRYLMTQVTYAIDYLKTKEELVTFRDIFRYLSILDIDDQQRRTLEVTLGRHPRIEFDPKGLGGKGSYRYRPIHNVRGSEELQAYLQRQTTAQGIPMRELKDGWPGAIEAVDKLEADHTVLVTRNKKDLTPKNVWSDDPTLHNTVDPEFVTLWHQVKLPTNQGDLRAELVSLGLTPTSQAKSTVVKPKEKKRKPMRRGGKTTNTHMAGILKDYSHLRK
ncbi:MAG: hypothetical protein M1828_002251 [Chrysothrix sp. TS-e1954]|nr:MAG: hypothetical protein M1828_002251 [Chrysothrix sp. TS-e1954]